MLRFVRHLVAITLFVIFSGCAGGGCASGCSCGGITPLPQGFPADERIENAAAIRITDTGLGFLSDNLGTLAGAVTGGSEGGGALSFPIPSSSGSQLGISFDVCPGGPDENATPPKCLAEIDLANADLSLVTTSDHNIKITGPLPVRLQDLPLDITYLFIPSSLNLTLTGNGGCPGDTQDYALIQLTADISIEIDANPMHSRQGYSRVKINEITLDEDDLADQLKFCGGFDAGLLNALKGILVPQLIGPLLGSLDGQLEEALCQSANPDLNPPCPDGTVDVDGICRYENDPDADCASTILGLDGNVNLGGLLSSLSPGTTGGFNFLLAAGGDSKRDDASGFHWGDLNPVAGGASLGMYGGATPTPLSGCVEFADIALPSGIPMPDEILGNTVADWPMETPGPHFGMALSERYTNYLLAQMYNSGALCLGITGDALGDAIPLSTGLLSVALGALSMTEMGHQKETTSLAMAIRPGAPPTVEFGSGTNAETDPLLALSLPNLSIDFYAWSMDRFVRVMTAQMDLTIPLNLAVTPDGLVPAVKAIGIKNTKVSNTTLIREDPEKIATAVETLLGSVVGSFIGDALPTIDLNEQLASLGMTLEIPPSVDGKGSPGLRKITKGSDDFLGIFAAFGLPMMMPAQQSQTQAEVEYFDLDPEGLELTTMTRENAPRLGLRLGSDLDDGRQAIEWQYKVDSGPWSPFTTARAVDIVDPWLRAQGRHYVRVRSRVVGDVYSLDADPERLEILVDTKAPHIRLDRDVEGPPRLHVSDAVSPQDATNVRLRYGERGDDGTMQWDTWSAWHPASKFDLLDGGDATHVEVEARDESENVGQIQQPLLRGKAVADAAGCQCLVGSRPAPSNPAAWWSILGLAAAAMFRRRRRQEQPQSASPPRLSQSIRPVTIALFLLASGGWAGCSCSETTGGLEAGCRGRGDCEVLLPGLVGGYSSAEVNAKGELWVSGYLEGNWFDDYSYGDLVVGRYDGQRVDWIVIDGVPNEPAVDLERYDIKGFRRGQTEYGDDVGLWTSLAFNSGDEPAVAYYDKTNRALRYANRKSGVWQTATVAQASGTDVGRYAKLLMVGGKPVIAYQFSEAQPDGSIHSGVRLAHGSTVDAADASWTHEDVVSDATTPCRAYLCASGTRCVKSNGRCEASSQDCATDCDDGLKCVTVGGEPTCEAVDAPAALVTYPDAVGLYVSAALTPEGQIGLAYYDRLRGNLMVATPNADGYTTLIADGEADGQSTGDRGIGSSLAIDAAGDYHIAYVDGLAERLMYVRVSGGTTPATPEAVDDGLSVDGTPHPDKQHIVGDDPHLTVASSGDVQISYQDASAGTLRFATGSVNGDAHDWARKLIPQDGFGGFFSRQVNYDGSLAITNFWRVASPQAQGDVRVLRP